MQGIGINRQEIRARDADQLARYPGGIGGGAGQVEDGAFANGFADRGQLGERGMVFLREEKADAKIGERCLCRFHGPVQIQPHGFEHIGGAAQRRCRAVAMLGHWNFAGGNDNGDGGGDIQAMRPVATRAADVDGIGGRVHADHPRAHGLYCACNFLCRFVPVGHVGKQGGDFGVGHFSVKHLAE